MQGRPLTTGILEWTAVTGHTAYWLKWGTTKGSRPNTETFGPTVQECNMRDILPGPGVYYASVLGVNGETEGTESDELEFTAHDHGLRMVVR